MPDVQEMFRAATEKVRPDPGALARQHRRQRRAGNNRKLAAFAAVASIALAAVAGVVLLENRREPDPIATHPALEPGLYLVDVRTGETAPFHDPGPYTYDFEFSPDGSTLVMVHWDEEREREQIWLADADGTNLRQVTHDDYGAVEPTWFPDGERIAFVAFDRHANRQIFVLDLATGDRTQVTREPSASGALTPDVSPDGRTIVYSTARSDRTLDGSPVGLVREVDLGSGTVETLLRNEDGWAYGPVRSPSGVIAYSHKSKPAGDLGEIWLLGTDGRASPAIALSETVSGAERPMWSPDGRLIAFNAMDPSGVWNVWVYDPATGERRLLSPGGVESWYGDDRVLIGFFT